MRASVKLLSLVIATYPLVMIDAAVADDVKIISAKFTYSGKQQWSVDVTLKHGDTGWEHYADEWRVVDADNHVLGNRVLLHPHVAEQPFTRGLSNLTVPVGITVVYVEAHDKVHGWSPDRLKIDLIKASGGQS